MQELKGAGRSGKGHHTWLFMVGYVFKGRGTEGYREFSKNIPDTEKRDGHEEYVKYGAVNKHCVHLTPYNIISRAQNFDLYKLRCGARRNEWRLEEVVMKMLQSGNYVMAESWGRCAAGILRSCWCS
jgi:hypothetical protein